MMSAHRRAANRRDARPSSARTARIGLGTPFGDSAQWENSVTMRSTSLARMYQPGICCRSRTRERVPRRRDWLRLHQFCDADLSVKYSDEK